MSTEQQYHELRQEIAELKAMVQELVAPQKRLKSIEMARIVNEAHASGDRSRIRQATKITAGR